MGARAWKDVKGKVLPSEVFLCTTVNTNPIQSIEGHATILSFEQYEVWTGALRPQAPNWI